MSSEVSRNLATPKGKADISFPKVVEVTRSCAAGPGLSSSQGEEKPKSIDEQ